VHLSMGVYEPFYPVRDPPCDLRLANIYRKWNHQNLYPSPLALHGAPRSSHFGPVPHPSTSTAPCLHPTSITVGYPYRTQNISTLSILPYPS
jgi:hypothetical protein